MRFYGKRLFLFPAGTGVAPFAAVIRDPETYDIFDHVILTQTCRTIPELGYARAVINTMKTDALVREMVGDKLVFYDSLTRETYHHQGRITDLMRSGQLYKDLAISPIEPRNRSRDDMWRIPHVKGNGSIMRKIMV